MRYQVRFVGDSELPSGLDYVFARVDGETYLFMKRSAVGATAGRCDALTRSFNLWEAAQSVKPSRGLVRAS